MVIVWLAGFALSAAFVPVARLLAAHYDIVARPTDDRWHQRVVPKLGGVAIEAALVLALTFAGVIGRIWPLVVATSVMFVVGLLDDLRPIKPATKLVPQTLAAALLLYLMPTVRITGAPIVDLLLAFIWLVGITNAFNLLDNIDGLSAGVAAIAGAFVVWLLRGSSDPAAWPLALAMAGFVGVAAAFLLYNFQPASIFMGDSGSYVLGFFMAGAALLAVPRLASHAGPAAMLPIVVLLVPIFDTAFVTVTRRLAGRSAFAGGRDHTSHRLVALGIGERRAVFTLYALTAAGGSVAVGLQRLQPAAAWALIASYVIGVGAVGTYLGHVEAGRPADTPPMPLLPSELTSRYRGYEIALDTVLLGLAYYVSFTLRFADPEFSHFLPYFSRSLPLVVGIQLATLWVGGKYRAVWRSLGPMEIVALVRSLLVGVGVTVIGVLYLHGFIGYSREVFVFDAILAPLFVVGARAGLGTVDEYLRLRRSRGRTALIYGAGRGGALALRELLQNPELGLTPVGFIDDDPSKRRLRVDGMRVVGTTDELDGVLARLNISCVVVSIRDISRAQLDHVIGICDGRKVEVRRIRIALEDSDWRDRTPGIVRFPGS